MSYWIKLRKLETKIDIIYLALSLISHDKKATENAAERYKKQWGEDKVITA